MLCTSLESGGGALCLCQDNESRPGILSRPGLARLLQMALSLFQHTHVVFLFLFCSIPTPSLPTHPFLRSAAPGLRFAGECGWMHGRTAGSPCSLWLVPNLRTQLPGETTMTPPPHTQPARRGPPVGDTLHRAATTAASKVSATQKLALTVHKHTHRNTPYIFALTREGINARACGRRSMQNILIIMDE